jgi:hypothetical protein
LVESDDLPRPSSVCQAVTTTSKSMRWMSAALAALLFWSTPARADSDGAYCAGHDYLAFEVRPLHVFLRSSYLETID